KVKPRLKAVSEKFGKKVIFMEIGCRSAKGCSAMPWDFQHKDLPFDEDEQDRFYSSALKAFSNEPWFDGFFWWDWQTKLDPNVQYGTDTGFSIIGKKAEKTLTEWYHKL
ncbi:MAG: glycoside hydrolase family 113, partial [Oscillospiraceae bacterium]